jgi:hypothetical protein
VAQRRAQATATLRLGVALYGAVRRALRTRTATVKIPPEELKAVCVGYARSQRFAFSFAAAVRKLTQLATRLGGAWEEIKTFLGWSGGVTALAENVRALLDTGKKTLQRLFNFIREKFPLNVYFVPAERVPTLTALLKRLVEKIPALGRTLARIKSGVGRLDALFDKYLPTFKRPILAALFAWIWFNVAELSWDMPSIVRGFLGKISVGELFESLPESGLGLVASLFGLGYGALPVAVAGRILWLAAQEYLTWDGRALHVRWERLGAPPKTPDEAVPLT